MSQPVELKTIALFSTFLLDLLLAHLGKLLTSSIFFFSCKNTNVIAFTKVWSQTNMLHSFPGHPVLMISVVLISSLLFSLLLLASHISLSSNNSDTWLLLFSLYLLLTFKYCLSCCNLKPVPYKSIPQCYYYITPL